MKCPHCGAWNSNDALRCSQCNFPFRYLTWMNEGGFWATYRAGFVAGLIIVLVGFPLLIGIPLVLQFAIGTQWVILPIAVSIIDACLLFRFRNVFMRIGGFGSYKRDWWREEKER
jgi:hypothetical protein